MGLITAICFGFVVLGASIMAIIASSGVVVIPGVTDRLFGRASGPDVGYAIGRQGVPERRDRMVSIGDELRSLVAYGIRPDANGFELDEQDVADILAEFLVSSVEGAPVRRVAVDVTRDSVGVFLEVDVENIGSRAGVRLPWRWGGLSFGITTVVVETEVRFTEDTLQIDVLDIQVGRLPALFGNLLAFIGDEVIDRAAARAPVRSLIEELVLDEGRIHFRFRAIAG